jgi:hypothetical protein
VHRFRTSRPKLRTLPAALVLLLGLSRNGFAAAGTVYLVVGSDTAIWNAGTTVDVFTRHPHYKQDSFTDTNAPVFQVMSPAWRSQFKDSFGQTIKFTWWMMGGNIYRDADNLNVPVANTMTLHLMQQYHGQAIRQFGDELSLHYHTFLWSDYNGSGTFFWNQTRTFAECRADFDVTLAQYLLEESVFPVSFRSGWHFMDQEWQAYLNQLIPYCFHDNYPVKQSWYTNPGPIAGVEDWSHAPAAFIPFHPSTNDYQLAGNNGGWNVRSVKIQAVTQAIVDHLFTQATAGTDQVACFWTHLPENFVANIARLGSYVNLAASNAPAVKFRYCTAVEAMQRWRGMTNLPPPSLEIGADWNTNGLSLAITSSVPIFQSHPFVCVRDAFQQYYNVSDSCRPTSETSWVVSLPVPTNLLAKVGVAITDRAGNVATRVLRFLPDDLYLDNQDSQYTEGQGAWLSTTNAAWGTDARVSNLSTQTSAEAGWALPLQWSGRYRISTQVPAVLNPATNVLFQILADGSNVLSTILPAGVPTGQWTFIGSVVLDRNASNHVQMAVSGEPQPGATLAADVIRVVPAPESVYFNVSPQQGVEFISTPRGFLVRWSGASGAKYTVKRTFNLGEPWETEQIEMPSRAGILEFEEEQGRSEQAFYRILEQ